MFDKVLEPLARRTLLFAIRQLRKDVRELTNVAKALVDSYRVSNRLEPLYSKPDLTPSPKTESFILPGDHLTYWILELLAVENHIPVDDRTDLEALAIDRGWLSPTGDLLVLPAEAVAAGVTLEGWRAEVRGI